jgi:predicted RNA binding protein YcfA (HicA-like mRNA interferase family)
MHKSARPKDVVRMLEAHGFICVRQRGSHMLYRHDDGRRTTVPMHNKELRRATLHSILKDTQLTLEDL